MKSLKIILICLYLSACQNPQQEKISQDDLILVSIKEKSNITFKRVGAKETEIKESVTENTIDQDVKLNEQSENEETNQ